MSVVSGCKSSEPRDIAISGCTATPYAETVSPPFTSLRRAAVLFPCPIAPDEIVFIRIDDAEYRSIATDFIKCSGFEDMENYVDMMPGFVFTFLSKKGCDVSVAQLSRLFGDAYFIGRDVPPRYIDLSRSAVTGQFIAGVRGTFLDAGGIFVGTAHNNGRGGVKVFCILNTQFFHENGGDIVFPFYEDKALSGCVDDYNAQLLASDTSEPPRQG